MRVFGRRPAATAALAAVALLALLGGAEGKKKPFAKYARTLGAETEGALEAAFSAAASATADAADSAATGAIPLVDATHVDEGFKILKAGLNGDLLSVFRELPSFAALDKLWSQPAYMKALVDGVPQLQGLKAFKALAGKETITPQDGLDALQSFKDFIAASADVTEALSSPQGFAKIVEEWDALAQNDPEVKALYAQIEQGDQAAAEKLQEVFVQRKLGDLVDMSEWGLGGNEPTALKTMRSWFTADHNDLYSLMHQDDPVIKSYMDDPGLAMRQAKELMANRF